MSKDIETIREGYRYRFLKNENYRNEVWKVLCKDYFCLFVGAEHHVLDMGSGWGEFINNIVAKKKYAMDLNPDSSKKLNPDIVFLQQDCSKRWDVPEGVLDSVFSSNFLEHLPSKEHIDLSLAEANRALKAGGLIILMGPNIKYVQGKYWDFWDHYIPLTEQSLVEILRLRGFETHLCLPRFLPYSMSTGLTPPLGFLKLYLKLPIIWRLFGKQFLVVAKKK